MSEVKISRQILDLKRWSEQFEAHAEQYAQAAPYPHIQFDQFLETWAAEKANDSFPAVGEEGWTHYIHVNEKKHGLNKIDRIPSFLQKVIHQLNHPDFVAQISKLTGIPNLLPDPSLEGGGLHQTQRGGFLNIHADFTVHPHKRNWRRRVNLLIYLNEDWAPEYKGDLELWSRDMKACEQKIAPLFNRVVLFNTDQDSYHGLPEPIQCPEDRSRKSIALYYYTEERSAPKKQATKYRARPGDGFKSVWIWLDTKMVNIYNTLKGWLGINDDFVSKVLKWLNRK